MTCTFLAGKAVHLFNTLFMIERKTNQCFKWQNVALLEQEEDVNQLTEFFSYEHFYVIYCKFWELDTDHDLYVDQRDLAQHNDQGATSHFQDSFTDHEINLSCGVDTSLILSALSGILLELAAV